MHIEDDRPKGGNLIIKGIEGDMGEETTLKLLVQPDGDVTVDISDGKRSLMIEFCSLGGGGRDPRIAQQLRKLAFLLADIK